MSTTIGGGSKLQFYPTDVIETFKMIPLIAPIKRVGDSMKIRETMGEEHRALFEEFSDKNITGIDYNEYLYLYLVQNQKFDLLKELLYPQFYISSNNEKMVVADLFAGEGKWLEVFKFFENTKEVHLIANEIEQGRYEKIKSSKLIDESYFGSFEDLQLPKKSVSLMLFNPPYGGSDGIRNTKRYFNMILERDLMVNNEKKQGVMILVLRGDDLLDISEELVTNFQVNIKTSYRVNEDEYNKYKQFVIFAKKRKKPLDASQRSEFEYFQNEIKDFKQLIFEEEGFNINNIKYMYYSRPPLVDHKTIRENFKFIQNENKYQSKDNKVWKWIKDITELKENGQDELVIPRQPKTGELALIMASGYINGDISNPDGTANHVVIGGVKELSKSEIQKTKDKSGDIVEKMVTTRFSKPYLNLLVNNKGAVEIKELRSGE